MIINGIKKWYTLGLVTLVAYFIKTEIYSSSTLPARLHIEEGEHIPECQSFEIIIGKLNNASLIFLGEIHRKREETYACISALAKKGENAPYIIYQEGFQAGENCNHLMGEPVELRDCMGWDDMIAQDELEQLQKQVVPKIMQRNWTADTFNETMLKVLAETAFEERNLHHKRNQLMINTVKNKPKDHLGFVIAGNHHLVRSNDAHINDVAAAEYTTSEIEHLEENCVVLHMI